MTINRFVSPEYRADKLPTWIIVSSTCHVLLGVRSCDKANVDLSYTSSSGWLTHWCIKPTHAHVAVQWFTAWRLHVVLLTLQTLLIFLSSSSSTHRFIDSH